jgi:hypothetical protein
MTQQRSAIEGRRARVELQFLHQEHKSCKNFRFADFNMPVTIPLSRESWSYPRPLTTSHTTVFSEIALNLSYTNNSFPEPLFTKIANRNKSQINVAHHSFSHLNSSATAPRIGSGLGNGFVHGIIHAFQQDLHLVLRPNDVWQAVISQFAFYVTGHAEELRSKFVAHTGTEHLVLEARETLCIEPPSCF